MELDKITGELSALRASWRFNDNPSATQIIVSFENGYGASIISGPYSYGVELAVLDSEGHLTYDTPITSDVLGHLTPDTLREALLAIAAL
jgi:hypothetical protein